jgi:hypothetical protein
VEIRQIRAIRVLRRGKSVHLRFRISLLVVYIFVRFPPPLPKTPPVRIHQTHPAPDSSSQAQAQARPRPSPRKIAPSTFTPETTTVWSFPDRGYWATHIGNYRGNWSPYIPRNLILRYTAPGDLVLDQMAGSGTTVVECKLLGRRAVGWLSIPMLSWWRTMMFVIISLSLRFPNPFKHT